MCGYRRRRIHPRFLKELAGFLADPLCKIFRLSLDAGKLPQDWKLGVIKPIFKGGDIQNPQNYRPVCLTSVVCKVMERHLKNAIQTYLDTCHAVTTHQHGFVKSRSCVTNLLTARENWVSLADSGQPLDVIYIDFSKAFDNVPHRRLL